MHQQFNLQRVHPELVQELAEVSSVDAFLATTAATRLNAFLSGFAGDDALEEVAREVGWEVESLGRRLQEPQASRPGA